MLLQYQCYMLTKIMFVACVLSEAGKIFSLKEIGSWSRDVRPLHYVKACVVFTPLTLPPMSKVLS